jgi:glycine cleavage system aminomethyltransferase T
MKLWDALFEVGRKDGLVPTGLGCRDTLRWR